MALSLLHAVSETCFSRPELNILIVGLDGAGKTSTLERLKASFNKRSIPIDKIQPTAGLNIAKLDMCGCRVMFWDLGGHMHDLWDRYFADASAWIFVVDGGAPARFDEAKRAFETAAGTDLPCLLVANKYVDDAAFFGLHDTDRLRLQPADGVRDGVLWLVKQAKDRLATRL